MPKIRQMGLEKSNFQINYHLKKIIKSEFSVFILYKLYSKFVALKLKFVNFIFRSNPNKDHRISKKIFTLILFLSSFIKIKIF